MSEETTEVGTQTSPTGVTSMPVSEASRRLAEKWQTTDPQGEATPGDSDDTPPDDSVTDPQDEMSFDGDSSEAGAPEEVVEETDDGPAYFTSVDQVADAAGYSKNEFMQHLAVPVKLSDGRVENVNLHELTQGYQRGRAYQEQTQQVEQDRTRLQQQETQLQQRWTQQFEQLRANAAVANAYIEDQEKAIDEHFNGLDWARMRVESPSDAALLQADWDRAKKQVQESRDRLRQEYSQAAQQHQQQQAAQRQQFMVQQRQLLSKLRPEWNDSEQRTKDGQAIAQYLTERYGVSAEELQNLHDARALDMAYKAMMYDQAKAGAGKTQERVREQGQLLRPGASQQNRGRRPTLQRKAQDSQARLRRSGKQADGVSALADKWAARDASRR